MFSTLTFQENVVVRTEDFHLFLATLVALHFTPVSKRVSRSFGLQPSSVAWSLRACFLSILFYFYWYIIPLSGYITIREKFSQVEREL